MSTTSAPVVNARFERPAEYKQEINAAANHVRLLTIPKRRYFAIEGKARPGEQEFQDAISTLYPLAYTLHFILKKRGVEAPVGALEGLFWLEAERPLGIEEFTQAKSSAPPWTWRLMLPVPDEAAPREVNAARDEVRAKKNPPMIDRVTCNTWEEGRVAQIMHVGPYDSEAATIQKLHELIEATGLKLRGCHHEIYISDPRRTRPDRVKTIIRQPVA